MCTPVRSKSDPPVRSKSNHPFADPGVDVSMSKSGGLDGWLRNDVFASEEIQQMIVFEKQTQASTTSPSAKKIPELESPKPARSRPAIPRM